ncbi:Uncharacterized glycosyltransferase ykoT [uncultured Clostridium sp.]|uniref:Glycosyltransferase family 2 protein n=1 Tax=Muricoprocola aceti TaxID=2981772 RepID=A0ABT2SPU2_9FIRM|nr:glycosyltransferase family 2 protein [Muricoprocola aceti]MCU6726496.1 glycosyltransferase family 2 protein [Muricoprocola aceti]SCH92412.1 Uncharacterized glycosyltransferase ykoT [uncultured Clostridium sp.]
MEKLYIIIPAYNEQDNIEKVAKEWHEVVEQINTESRLVIINDGSKDHTYDRLCELKSELPQLQPLTKPNGGHGQTLLFGYKYAIKNKADFIFQTDSDGQTNPKEFKEFWNLRNKYDAVIGCRTKREDGKIREFVEKTLLLILRVVFGVKVPDSNAPFRLMKCELLEKYINKMPEDFNLPNVMLTTYFSYFKEKIKFIEITFKPRQAGTNSINIKKIVKIGWKAVGDFRKLKKEINM